MVQVPAACMVTLVVLTVQTDVVRLENVTGNPDDAVAEIPNEDAEYVRLERDPKVIDWLALLIANERVTLDAAFHEASPDCDAVRVQVPAPRIATV